VEEEQKENWALVINKLDEEEQKEFGVGEFGLGLHND
jgi:hypothetical protein